LLTLGMFVFGMDTLAYSDLQRRITWRHEASDRFGARPAVQFIGPGDDDVTIAAPASRNRGPLQRARYAGQHGRHRQCLGPDERAWARSGAIT
jgi:hypothetical protein